MQAYRYNTKYREDRKFNLTGREKNPNRVKFYSSNLLYAERYKYVYYPDGDINYECELEIKEIDSVRLFDMQKDFASLKAYKAFVRDQIEIQHKDFTLFLEKSKTTKDINFWQNEIEKLQSKETEIIKYLIDNEFQSLSDFEYQNILVKELKQMGLDGYFTKNEVAIF